MSEIRTDTINNASGDNDSGIDLSTNDQVGIKTANTTAVTVDASQNVGFKHRTNVEFKIQDATDAGGGTRLSSIWKGSGSDVEIGNVEIDLTDGNTGSEDANIMFKTISAGTLAERARLNSVGNFLVGTHLTSSTGIYQAASGSGTIGGYLGYDTTTPFATTNSGLCAIFNRHTSDGTMIELKQDNSIEGTISVSGTTVSYNGGHLSRWSQLADNSRDNTIVKGTVMTNLDQMAEWTTDGVTEDNEQLNCMAVSSVEGDANVAGVFVNWDDNDDVYTADMNVAMTGDMVIRIAQGTTVARGDLLMSAGDGTAKPQGDDIVRSKTIAKVTSTNVSHTYDDGSYLVPCVLMAC